MNAQKEILTETDKFYEIFGDEEHSHFNEFDTIVRIIDGMGHHEKGAEPCLFRFEDAAGALPSKRQEASRVLEIEVDKDSQLRLYCIRLQNGVVILLNGGVKTTNQPLKCPNVKKHFRFAQAVAKKIDELITDRSIIIAGTKIINNTGEEEITIYI